MSGMNGTQGGALVTATDAASMRNTLQNSLYPGAADASVDLVIGYCKAANLDVMQKPVHIVPMWDNKNGKMRDVVMPGIGLYRTQAARTGCAGVTEPEFGPDVTETIGGVTITYPSWCRVTVKRRQATGHVDEFTAREFWKENYAVKGGKEKSIAPNAMWQKRPYGQLAKCAEAQALRKAFPEIGAAPTADEMEGRSLEDDAPIVATASLMPKEKAQPAQAAAPNTEASDQPGNSAVSGEPEVASAADVAGKEASPAAQGELGQINDLTPSQCNLIRAKCAAAGKMIPVDITAATFRTVMNSIGTKQ
jgi:phage recombination protein Bet